MLTLFSTLTLFTIVAYIFFALVTLQHILRYKYKILTLKACNLQHSTNIDLSLDKVLVYYCRLQNAILPTQSIIFLVHKHYLLHVALTTFKTLHKITFILLTIRYKSYFHESPAPGDNIMNVAWLSLPFSKVTRTHAHSTDTYVYIQENFQFFTCSYLNIFSQNLNSVKKCLVAGAGCQLFGGKI